MSKLSEEYLKIIKDINEHISNEEERKYVMSRISEISALYMNIIDKVADLSSTRMEKLEEREDRMEECLSKVADTVDLIKKDIYEDEDYDFEIVCPYCGHEFVASVEDELKEEIECPECHNTIELDWDSEEDETGDCGGHCSGCGMHNACGVSEDDDEEESKNELNGQNEQTEKAETDNNKNDNEDDM